MIVLLEDAKLPRSLWRIARISELFRRQDGEVRAAQVKLPSGVELERSITQLYPLEVSMDDIKQPVDEPQTTGEIQKKRKSTKKSTPKSKRQYDAVDTNINQFIKHLDNLQFV